LARQRSRAAPPSATLHYRPALQRQHHLADKYGEARGPLGETEAQAIADALDDAARAIEKA
jgi:hypothetical protein